MAGSTGLRWWRTPDGTIRAVDRDGALVATPPRLTQLQGETLTAYLQQTGTQLAAGEAVVLDQWGHRVEPLYDEGTGGFDAMGNYQPQTPPDNAPAVRWWTDPTTGQVRAVDEAGEVLDVAPTLHVLQGEALTAYLQQTGTQLQPGQQVVLDAWGNPVTPLYAGQGGATETGQWQPTEPPANAPELRWTVDPTTGAVTAVDPSGTTEALPQVHVLEGDALTAYLAASGETVGPGTGPVVVDQWGNRVEALYAPGTYGLTETGQYQPTEAPENAPEMRWWQDPSTGQLVAVDASGTVIDNPPGIQQLQGDALTAYLDATSTVLGKGQSTVVLDQWGNPVQPLYPEGSGGFTETGQYQPTTAPTDLPEVRWWQDPTTGEVSAVSADGTPIDAPPPVHVLQGDALTAYLQQTGTQLAPGQTIVLDAWGNPVEPLWPAASSPIAEDGTLQPTSTPEGFEPPTLRYWEDPTTGALVAVDEKGEPLDTPPQLHELSGEEMQALGLQGPGTWVMDPWGNLVPPLHPPGNSGFSEDGTFESEDVPETWPPDDWPQAGSTEEASAGESDDEGPAVEEPGAEEPAVAEPGAEDVTMVGLSAEDLADVATPRDVDVAPPAPGTVGATPIEIPGGPEPDDAVAGRGSVAATPIEIPGGPEPDEAAQASGEDIALSPDDVEGPPTVVPEPPREGLDEVEATPITLPSPPQPPLEEVSATPITLPEPPAPPEAEGLATPIPLPEPPPVDDEIAATPITLPSPPEPPDDTVVAPAPTPGGDVAATPINLPNPVEQAGVLPVPLPGTATGADLSVEPEEALRVEIADAGTLEEVADLGRLVEPTRPDVELDADLGELAEDIPEEDDPVQP